MKCQQLNTSHLIKQDDILMSQTIHLENGIEKEKLKLLESEHIEDIKLNTQINLQEQNKKYVTVESQLHHKKMILEDRFSFLNSIILTTQLSLILDQESTLKEKVLKPYWNLQSKEISNKLWLPTKIDCVDSVLSCTKESSKNNLMGKSWFSINKKHPPKKNSLMTSFQLSQFSHPDCMDLEAIQLKTKSEPKLKTLKIRLLPSKEEKEQLQLIMSQYRWYYNTLLECFYIENKTVEDILKKDSFEYEEIRDLLSTYDFTEETFELANSELASIQLMKEREKGEINKEIIEKFKDDLKLKLKSKKEIHQKIKDKKKQQSEEAKVRKKEFKLQCQEMNRQKKKDEKSKMTEIELQIEQENERKIRKQSADENKQYFPSWWADKKPHTRIARGAAKKISQNVNSCISNYKNGNISKFDMKFMSQKKDTEYTLFEDKKYPAFIDKIKGRYWFTNTKNKKCAISYDSLLSQLEGKEKGCEIIYEKSTDKYFLHYPVEYDFFPLDDRRNENQVKYIYKGENVISLDPGVRKFMVGYDPSGTTVFIGQGSNKQLIKLLLDVDKNPSIKKWRKIKNMINELHWKTISFLVENYDVIILPDFRVSQMIKSNKLTRMTKRLMCMYSFNSFKEKLQWKCSIHKKKLFIVDESYTSKTCGVCGVLNDVGGNETYTCSSCGLVCDRDVSGARNIFIKNIRLRCP